MYIRISGSMFVLCLIGFFLLSSCGVQEGGDKPIRVVVKEGSFEAMVTTTGELQARESLDINGPTGLRRAGLWQVSITDLVEEGTRVNEGDYVATLDRSEASSRLKSLQSDLDKTKSQLTQAQLDTTLTLREAREQIVNLGYQYEEARITLEQSKFEPPAVIRQAQIAMEKAERASTQAVENYQIRKEKEDARLEEIETTMALQRSNIKDLVDLLDDFEIRAPAKGMVIYIRDWDGTRRGVGSTISPWQSSVATLPDLSDMISQTYINEVDVSRIQESQKVKIGIDAFPDREYSGEVISVANIGEQRPNSDAKVFEVRISIDGSDTTLRPAMTTSNAIITSRQDSALFIASECIHLNDSLSYVFLASGNKQPVRVEVITGAFNENETIVLAGLEAGQELFLSRPENSETLAWELLDKDFKAELLAELKSSQQPKKKAKPDFENMTEDQIKAHFQSGKGGQGGKFR